MNSTVIRPGTSLPVTCHWKSYKKKQGGNCTLLFLREVSLLSLSLHSHLRPLTPSLPQGSFVRGFAPEFDEVAVVRVRASVRLVIRVAVDFLLGAAQAKAAVFLLKFGKALANKTPFNAPVNFIARTARDFRTTTKAHQAFSIDLRFFQSNHCG